jgi:hypothetical protein
VFVDDDASGGDGSTHATAFRSIGAAIAGAPDGAVIAIAAGHYDEDLVVTRGLALVGACVSGTRLTSSRATDANVAALELGAGTSASNLSIDMAERNGIYVRGAGVAIDHVVIHAARIDGIDVVAGSADVHDVVTRDMRPSSTGLFGRGFETNGARLAVTHFAVEGSADRGAFADDPAGMLELTDGVIRGIVADATGNFGGAVAADRGGHVTLTSVVCEDLTDTGLLSIQGSTMEATDVVVRRVAMLPDGSKGRGAVAVSGSTLRLTRVLVEQVVDGGVIVDGAGSHLDATALVVRDGRSHGRPRADDRDGRERNGAGRRDREGSLPRRARGRNRGLDAQRRRRARHAERERW